MSLQSIFQKGLEITHFSVNYKSQCMPFLTPLSIQSTERATQRQDIALSYAITVEHKQRQQLYIDMLIDLVTPKSMFSSNSIYK